MKIPLFRVCLWVFLIRRVLGKLVWLIDCDCRSRCSRTPAARPRPAPTPAAHQEDQFSWVHHRLSHLLSRLRWAWTSRWTSPWACPCPPRRRTAPAWPRGPPACSGRTRLPRCSWRRRCRTAATPAACPSPATLPPRPPPPLLWLLPTDCPCPAATCRTPLTVYSTTSRICASWWRPCRAPSRRTARAGRVPRPRSPPRPPSPSCPAPPRRPRSRGPRARLARSWPAPCRYTRPSPWASSIWSRRRRCLTPGAVGLCLPQFLLCSRLTRGRWCPGCGRPTRRRGPRPCWRPHRTAPWWRRLGTSASTTTFCLRPSRHRKGTTLDNTRKASEATTLTLILSVRRRTKMDAEKAVRSSIPSTISPAHSCAVECLLLWCHYLFVGTHPFLTWGWSCISVLL